MKRSIKNAKWSQGTSRITKVTDKMKKSKIANKTNKLKEENQHTDLLNPSKAKK